ncbi:PRC-barrel domain-containing protein [Parvularcula dongshanensis]|uniref:PRC-barrel domain-containing protein n=1 Tax=Parvularcula dongshanensis TaxID=1173995 RepID=A0A840HZW8_9PROT|nr:PRC-barrel domain-containing protein [Parvularcula dongshanensis]MBB4657512.1 hypothetical protein [Parvularcula dongshanensis]
MTDYEKSASESRLKKFSTLSRYKLKDAKQDIRNLPLVTPEGVELGIIDDLLIDVAAKRVAAVALQGGGLVPVEPLEIQAHQVINHDARHQDGMVAGIY